MGVFEILKKEGMGAGARIRRSLYERHRQELEKKVSEALSMDDDYRAAWLYQLLGRLSRMAGDYEQCLGYLMQGIECSERAGKAFNTGWLYRIAGRVAIEKKDYPKAVSYALKAAEYFRKANCIYAVQWSYNLAANASELKGDLYSAISYLEKSLEIEGDKDAEKRLEALKEKIPHPDMEVSGNKERVREGEECTFTLTIKNMGKGVLRGIALADKEGEAMEKIDRLYPGDSRAFSYGCSGRLGVLHSRWRKVLWRTPLGNMERGIRPAEVRVVPNVKVSTSINPGLRLGKPSDFVVLIRNRSSSPIYNVRFRIGFPGEMEVRPETQDSFEKIPPGDEKGIVYTLIPNTVGESVSRDIGIEYRDEERNEYREKITPVVFRGVVEEEPLPMKRDEEVEKTLGEEGLKHLDRARRKRGYIQGLITANPISEGEYLALAGKLDSCSAGFSLGGVSLDTVSAHILNECSVFTLIGMREFKQERLFLFSGRSRTEMRTYLLTAAVEKDGDMFDVMFKAYSDRKDGLEEFLRSISDIVKYTIITMNFAKEIGKIEVKKVINIIDSIVQRSDIGGDREELKSREVRIRDSVVQRSGV